MKKEKLKKIDNGNLAFLKMFCRMDFDEICKVFIVG